MTKVRREDIKWALVEDGEFMSDDDGVMVFEKRQDARKYAHLWGSFYRRLEVSRQPPLVVKVSVRVEEIYRKGVSDDD